MLKQKKNWGILILVFSIFFLSLTLFGGSGISLAIKGISPILVISILVPFSAHFSVSQSAAAGVLCGAVLDSSSVDGYCFNTVALLLLSVGAHLLAHSVFIRNLKANVTLCFLVTLLYLLCHWLIFIAFFLEFSDNLRYLLQTALPSSAYTAVLSIPFYFIFRKIKN